jgi:sugar (pentulose or hexulose) kinase
MAVGGRALAPDPARDVLVNVSALGQAVPSARFMGGREYETEHPSLDEPDAADRAAVLDRGAMLLPALEPGSGPFQGRRARWRPEPGSPGQRAVVLSHYLALMTATCLDLAGAAGPAVIEGPLARNPDLLDMLAAVWPGGVETSASATGTARGAALLCLPQAAPPTTRPHPQPEASDRLRAIAAAWRRDA